MYSFAAVLILAGAVVAAPQYAPVAPAFYGQSPVKYAKPVAIVKFIQDNNFDGTFNYAYESENGISNEASGYVKAISPKEQVQVVQGVYSYTAPDGTPIVTRWYADETGFHAEGAHLPVAPPVPEAIARALAYQASLPPTPEAAPARTRGPVPATVYRRR